MELYETILIIAGSILFVFAMVVVVFLIKKQQSFLNAIWLLLIAFFMIGFSAISNAEIFGLLKYEKQEKLAEIETLSDASQICPDNSEIKERLIAKVNEFKRTENVKSAEDNAILGYAYYSIGDQDKAIHYSKEALSKDNSNNTAQGVIDLAKTRKLIEESPPSHNKDRLKLEFNNQLKSLENNPNIDKNQINKLKEDMKFKSGLINSGSGQIQH